MIWIAKHKMARLLRQGAVLVHVSTPAATVGLRVGLPGCGLQPDVPDLVLGDDGWSATLVFGGTPRQVFVHWSSVLRIDLATPPPGGGSPASANEYTHKRAA